ncbi:protein DUF642 L-GALACTONO-1,4-LACTONE-RESPONSIVE GENE 2-like [Prosopis cineraria]|uniref:protein DUF642 L-GALACTONO-1,4-LACTONE-RESPONSIVE GENE 2-like n=1 Tax=Prosopis cineraria TaxID=364024 RepID=UPI00240F5366|nr:protein DUF642 L-GALACTONO-1,4-LACTONE-RESPONSIVE GENE 2-like [Prosopis cineraria]
MRKLELLLLLFLATCHTIFSIPDGLLPNGNFELGPKPSQLKGTVVTARDAIPEWTISGFVEYIKAGKKQDDMVLLVPEGASAVRLGNEASIMQKVKLVKGMFYSITFSAGRTCAQEEKINVSVTPTYEKRNWGVFPIQTVHSSHGWDFYACGFRADNSDVEIVIHNTGAEEHPACGPIVDSVALAVLNHSKRTNENLLKNGDFEDGPYVFPNVTNCGVLIPPNMDDPHSPLPGWIIESLKSVKYIDSDHFFVPKGKRAIELVAGKESAIAQVVRTQTGWIYDLSFAVGDANNACEGSMTVEAFAGKETVKVSYDSKGKGGFVRGKLRFKAASSRTRITFFSTFYSMKTDGSLCGPVLDDVKLLSAHYFRHR